MQDRMWNTFLVDRSHETENHSSKEASVRPFLRYLTGVLGVNVLTNLMSTFVVDPTTIEGTLKSILNLVPVILLGLMVVSAFPGGMLSKERHAGTNLSKLLSFFVVAAYISGSCIIIVDLKDWGELNIFFLWLSAVIATMKSLNHAYDFEDVAICLALVPLSMSALRSSPVSFWEDRTISGLIELYFGVILILPTVGIIFDGGEPLIHVKGVLREMIECLKERKPASASLRWSYVVFCVNLLLTGVLAIQLKYMPGVLFILIVSTVILFRYVPSKWGIEVLGVIVLSVGVTTAVVGAGRWGSVSSDYVNDDVIVLFGWTVVLFGTALLIGAVVSRMDGVIMRLWRSVKKVRYWLLRRQR